MRAQERYTDTETFHWHNANPKGRITEDCWVRAISTALGQDYNETLLEMAQLQIQTGYAINGKKNINTYMASKGWHRRMRPRKLDMTYFTGKEFCEKIAEKGERYLANIGGHHIVAIVDKKVWDTWDSTYKTIGNFWVKEN